MAQHIKSHIAQTLEREAQQDTSPPRQGRVAVIIDRDLYEEVSKVSAVERRSIKAQFNHIVTQFLKEYNNGNN